VSSDWFIQGFVGVEPSESKRLASGGGPPGGHPVKGTGGKEPKPKTKHPKIGGVWGYWVRVEIFEINSDENFRTGVSKHSWTKMGANENASMNEMDANPKMWRSGGIAIDSRKPRFVAVGHSRYTPLMVGWSHGSLENP
jgi:hypothetical protein